MIFQAKNSLLPWIGWAMGCFIFTGALGGALEWGDGTATPLLALLYALGQGGALAMGALSVQTLIRLHFDTLDIIGILGGSRTFLSAELRSYTRLVLKYSFSVAFLFDLICLFICWAAHLQAFPFFWILCFMTLLVTGLTYFAVVLYIWRASLDIMGDS